jgi:Domain of unknown function (DUF4397)
LQQFRTQFKVAHQQVTMLYNVLRVLTTLYLNPSNSEFCQPHQCRKGVFPPNFFEEPQMGQLWKFPAIAFVGCAMLISSACGGSSSTHLRLLNAATLQSSLDLVVDSKDIASSVAYGSASGYVSVSSGSRHIQVEPTGTTNILIDLPNSTISSGTNNTVIATNSSGVVVADTTSTPSSGNISIRAINASPTLGTADVYVVSAGTDITGVNPTASSVAFPSATSYQTVAAGNYEVIFTQPGGKVPVVTGSPSSFTSGQVRSVVALDAQNGGFTTAVLSDIN